MPAPGRNDDADDEGAGDPVHDRHVAAVAAAYQLLDSSFDALHDRSSPEERQRLRELLASARDAYWRAVASRLGANNPIVRDLYNDLVRATQELNELLANLQRVSAVIDLATATIRLAASLVTLAAV
jgi:hypothetical protein